MSRIDRRTNQCLASDHARIGYSVLDNEKYYITHTLNRSLNENYYGFGMLLLSNDWLIF
jgi:hypothetical protein